MKYFSKLLLLIASFIYSSAFGGEFVGAGSTFGEPVITKWATSFQPSSKLILKYEGIGSGAGVEKLFKDNVDFAASDEPLPPDELEQRGLVQFPYIIGAIVPVINLKDIKSNELQLTGQLLADIYLGNIRKWNDPKIVAINPNLKLPDLAITPVYRKDSSGSTFVFTYFLNQTSSEWKQKIGATKKPALTLGIAEEGTKGVLTKVSQELGAIGYVEYGRARKANLVIPKIQNRDGNFVEVNTKTVYFAARMGNWGSGTKNYVLLTHQAGAESWPLTTASFILIKTNLKDEQRVERIKSALELFNYSFRKGVAISESLDYVKVPDEFIRKIVFEWRFIKGPDNKSVWTTQGSSSEVKKIQNVLASKCSLALTLTLV